MTNSPIVTFVVDKELDIANYFAGFNGYKHNKEIGFEQTQNDLYEKILKSTSQEEARAEVAKSIEKYYEKGDKLISIAEDINKEWSKMESEFIKKLEEVHGFPFKYDSIKGVLSSASKFGYNTGNDWFATSMFRNKFGAIDTATHELMHFMFHKYYDQVCKEKGLSENQMWDVKESFTVLLNLEFDNFRFQQDGGYTPHAKIREAIKESWLKDHDFAKALDRAIEVVKQGYTVGA